MNESGIIAALAPGVLDAGLWPDPASTWLPWNSDDRLLSFPFYDLFHENGDVAEILEELPPLLAGAQRSILEIGAGTGLITTSPGHVVGNQKTGQPGRTDVPRGSLAQQVIFTPSPCIPLGLSGCCPAAGGQWRLPLERFATAPWQQVAVGSATRGM